MDIKEENFQLKLQLSRLIEIIKGLPKGSLEPTLCVDVMKELREEYLREILDGV